MIYCDFFHSGFINVMYKAGMNLDGQVTIEFTFMSLLELENAFVGVFHVSLPSFCAEP